MTEKEARDRVLHGVPRETAVAIESYIAALTYESERQNLVSRASLDHVWERHILDSAQLVALTPDGDGAWLDIGSGAGLPGLVIAALVERPVVLAEPRAKRCMFLRETAERMGLGARVTVVQSRMETAPNMTASIISARAVAGLGELFAMGSRFAAPPTIWVLPKGRSAAEEVALARASWHARVELVPSITDPEATIVVASDVRAKKGTRA